MGGFASVSASALYLLLLCELLVHVCGKHSHPVPTFFDQVDEKGNVIDRNSHAYSAPYENKTWIHKIPREYATTVKLQAWPEYVRNGDKVTVLWSGLVEPQPDDVIFYFCPYYETDAKHYLDYRKPVDCPTWERGYGHFELPVYNMRDSCVFKYWRHTRDAYVLAAVSNLVQFADGGPAAPLHGHISLTTKHTEMRVMFTTGRLTQAPLVRYGTTKQLAMREYAHTTETYEKDDFCQSPANARGWFKPGYLHDFLLTNLHPTTLYYYSYGTEDHMSDVANFTTPLPAGDKTPFKFIVYGDMGVAGYPMATSTAQYVHRDMGGEHNIKYVFHIGDISYARGWAYVWEKWWWLTSPIATLVPYMVGTGNHEYDHTDNGIGHDPSNTGTKDGWRPKWWNGGGDSGGECGLAIARRYHMPDNGNGIFWYSYDYGMVHMIMMSTEHDYSPGSVQYKWLENDMNNVDRKVTPWLFIGGHRPMYSSQKIHSDYVVAENMQKLFEDLLYKYKVDIAFWAHYHSYERTCKVYKNKCVKDGIIHIVTGAAGMWRDGEGWYAKEWSIAKRSCYGYNRIAIVNDTSLYYEFLDNSHNDVVDNLWIHKV